MKNNCKILKFLLVLSLSLFCKIDAKNDDFFKPQANLSDRIKLNLDNFKVSPIQQALKSVTTTGLLGALAYTATSHLIQEDFLVNAQYPHAQAWYDDMAKKYPQAHLEKKLFLQNNWGWQKKAVSWSSTFKHILFPQDALKRINSLYKLKLNQQTLSEEDELFLAEQEFVLLHEAGHIEHADLTTRLLAVGVIGAGVPFISSDKNVNSAAHFIGVLFGVHFLLSRYQERQADKFAYENADEKALLGGIQFFEQEEINSLAHIENKKLSPYIKVDSTIGTAMQKLVSLVENQYFYINKAIKIAFNSTAFTRWLYELPHFSHPGPSERIESIKAELEKRKTAKK